MLWPWQRYDEGSRKITSSYLVERFGIPNENAPEWNQYLALREDRLFALFRSGHRPIARPQLKSGGPNCIYASRLCLADIERTAFEAGLVFCPAVGKVSFWRPGAKVPHQDIVAVPERGNEWYYDPITCIWRRDLGGSQARYQF